MKPITLYTNRPAAETLLQLVKIARKVHGYSPSPVDIKKELAELNTDMLSELEQNFTDLLKPEPIVDTNADYWDCNCTQNYIHARNNSFYCELCDTHSIEAPDSRTEEVVAFINEKLSK